MLMSRCVSTSQRDMEVTISKLWIARIVLSSSHDEVLGFGHVFRYSAVNVAWR